VRYEARIGLLDCGIEGRRSWLTGRSSPKVAVRKRGRNVGPRVAGSAAAQIIGAAPEAASPSGLTCAPGASGQWLGAVTIDV
jgi:hypothetical protein